MYVIIEHDSFDGNSPKIVGYIEDRLKADEWCTSQNYKLYEAYCGKLPTYPYYTMKKVEKIIVNKMEEKIMTEREMIINALRRINRVMYYNDNTYIKFKNRCYGEDIIIEFDNDGNIIDIHS